jgi:aldehyde:ferredoxin oxidoreductase
MCMFLPYSPKQMVDPLSAVTSWEVDLQETQAVGQRAIILGRVFNLRDGLPSADDALPERFYAPFQKGEARTARPLSRETFEWAKSFYYGVMGWDVDTGAPTP